MRKTSPCSISRWRCAFWGGIDIILSPYETVLFRGDTLRCDIEIINNTDEVQGFNFATYVTLPNGRPYGPLVGPVTIEGLLPGWKIVGYMEHRIPNLAPYGYYNYHAIAREADIIVGKDRFEFIVNVVNASEGTGSRAAANFAAGDRHAYDGSPYNAKERLPSNSPEVTSLQDWDTVRLRLVYFEVPE